MCGIVGVVGQSEAAPLVLKALKKLEYRGYDSAGIATAVNSHLELRKGVGKLDEVEIADYEAALGNFVNVEETKRTHELLEARRADLEALMLEWEDVAQLIEANS